MESIARISLTDKVVNRIKNMILLGKYPAGQKIPSDTKLCEELGVSRPTIREAIKVLSALGYINIVVGKGAFVTDIEKTKNINSINNSKPNKMKYFQDFMQVRLAIEPAAMKIAVPIITEPQIDELEKIHKAFIQAINQMNIVKLMMLDETFHAKIIQFSGNQLMININKYLNDNMRKFRADSFSDPIIYHNASKPHEKILYYMKRKNTSKSVEALQNHLNMVEEDIQSMLKRNIK